MSVHASVYDLDQVKRRIGRGKNRGIIEETDSCVTQDGQGGMRERDGKKPKQRQ